MNKSDGKLKLMFNFVVVVVYRMAKWHLHALYFWSFSTLQFNFVCVCGMRIEFSCVLQKTISIKASSIPSIYKKQERVQIYPINAIIVDFVALDILAGLVAWCMVYKYYGNIQKLGKIYSKSHKTL